MNTKRGFTTLAATLLAAAGVATVYSPAASATSSVFCSYETTYTKFWFNCESSNGAQTIWYVNGVHQPSADGAGMASFFCTYHGKYTISVNSGTSLAASWTGYCDDLHN